MTQEEQTKAFWDDLSALTSRYAAEFDLTYATIIGALHMKAWQLSRDSFEDDDEDSFPSPEDQP